VPKAGRQVTFYFLDLGFPFVLEGEQGQLLYDHILDLGQGHG
jgi:hypothetical protein